MEDSPRFTFVKEDVKQHNGPALLRPASPPSLCFSKCASRGVINLLIVCTTAHEHSTLSIAQ
eukprot:4878865-Amphidinium_carterae.1